MYAIYTVYSMYTVYTVYSMYTICTAYSMYTAHRYMLWHTSKQRMPCSSLGMTQHVVAVAAVLISAAVAWSCTHAAATWLTYASIGCRAHR